MANDNEQREIIISAAARLFSRFGLEKTTMEDIARAAGKGKSTLYYYFRSKEEVFAEVIRKEIDGLKDTIGKAVEKEDDPYDKFRKFVLVRLGYLSEKADQYTTIAEEYLKHYEFISSLTSDYSSWEINTIRGIVEYGRGKGSFMVADSGTVSRAIFFALKGLEYPWAIDPARKEMEKSVDVLVEILLKGISKQ
ncbi:MAG: TetR/AcrR family transcriptional regulator [Deltaproteobacteria bacterium]|nr:TetR/AcrR family transcriptional regulator [Deltaproteobacteria bacterium]MBW2130245.1 TetR/AcrR family transcriptional regulator [Deltaproteobacteria bacterium]MBW2302549.1 TetR/AcrR family transcriptional regulator [Deltaproteobacteria bacterium]